MVDERVEASAKYWNINRAKANDPAFWMAHPLCRQAINRRVSGDPNEWPLDWFKRVHAQTAFRSGVSWGCGLGAFERSAIRCGIALEINAFDISSASLADAERLAAEENIPGIHYQLGNFDDPAIPPDPYDIAFFHASLHHVSALERLFRRLTRALQSGGAIYVDEYVGPSRHDWTAEQLGLAQALLDLAPASARLTSKIELPIQADDPSEAVRSSEISGFLRTFFDIKAWRPYGGQLADVIMPCLSREWTESPEGHEFVAAVLAIEDYELNRDPSSTHHLVAYGTLKRWPRLLPPLSDQAISAVGRRLRRLF